MLTIQLTRVYDVNGPFLTPTYLVDRLWPRGISKQKLEGVIWLKELAPSNELRKWFHHNLSLWDEFKRHYLIELKRKSELQPLFVQLKQQPHLTLLYSSKESERNHAIVLRDFLLNQ